MFSGLRYYKLLQACGVSQIENFFRLLREESFEQLPKVGIKTLVEINTNQPAEQQCVILIKQFKQLAKNIKRQRNILEVLMHDVLRRLGAAITTINCSGDKAGNDEAAGALVLLLHSPQSIHIQQHTDKKNMYAPLAPKWNSSLNARPATSTSLT